MGKCGGLFRGIGNSSDWLLESEFRLKRNLIVRLGLQTCPLVNSETVKVFNWEQNSSVRLFWHQEVKLTQRKRDLKEG